MKKRILSPKLFSIVFSCFFTVVALAQSPVVKTDFNMSGRSEEECNDPNYTAWIPDNAGTISKTINGITFTFKKYGNNGEALRADWYKAGVQTPYFARLVCDGFRVDGADNGAEIELTISGLSSGTHSVMTYHNGLSSKTCAPIDVLVNGSTVINDLSIPLRATATADAAVAYVTFNATAGQNTVIRYRAETSSSAEIKNVYICGFELNTPNAQNQAQTPIPGDGDYHANANNGSVNLQWTKAGNAASHNVYFGTSNDAVSNANTSSSEFKGNQTGTSYGLNGLYTGQTYYWRIDEIDGSGSITKGNTWSFRPAQLAFPDAEGYGRYAIGGRGGVVVHVTNLNDSGPGSFREAVENEIGPRTIVFDVAGVIALESRLVLNDPYVTVAGQTAPGKGICFRKAPIGFTGNDVIVRHVRLRLGAGPTFDGMGMTGANHSIMDHCSISWTIDESFSSRGSKNITLQRTLISEALNAANHQNYPAGTEHGYAATIGGDVGSFHHNLLAHNYGRNWSMGGGLDGNGYYAGRLDISNNVVYNWGGRTTDGGAFETNFINNYYKPGPGSKIFNAMSIQHENTGLGTQRGYFSGNVMPGYFDENNQSAGRTESYHNGDYKKYEGFVNAPFFPSHITMQSARDAYKDVLSDVGANQPFFDNHDIRMVNETLNGSYSVTGSVTGKKGFPDHQNDAGGYESYPSESRPSSWDTDKDGLPNWWERLIGTNENSSSGDFSDSNADLDADGYNNLEEYLDWMANPHYLLSSNQVVEIELKTLFRGYTSGVSYTVTGSENGNASISGTKVTFEPSSCGFSSFSIKVNDNQGGTLIRSIGVFSDSPNGDCSLKMYDCAGVEDGTAILDECGICTGGTTGVTSCSGAIQGEDFCEAIGVQEASNLGYIGTGYVNFDNAVGSSGSWNLYAENATVATIGIRYANGGGAARSMSVAVNGTGQATFSAQPTTSWTTWETEYITLNLSKGVNNIQLVATTADGGPNVDLLAFTDQGLSVGGCTEDCNGVLGGAAYLDDCATCVGGNTGLEACVQDCEGNWGGSAYLDACNSCVEGNTGASACNGSLEAEEACDVLGIQLEDKNEGFSGAGYVNVDNAMGSYATWVINSASAQNATLAFRYANGGTTSRDGAISINGLASGDLILPSTGGWTTWEMASVDLPLVQGNNEIRVAATTADGLANIDLIAFYTEGLSDAQCGLITGSGHLDNAALLTVYPNPTSGTIYWGVEQNWTLLNLQGKEVAKGTGKDAEISDYPKGVYFLKLEGQIVKILKQ